MKEIGGRLSFDRGGGGLSGVSRYGTNVEMDGIELCDCAEGARFIGCAEGVYPLPASGGGTIGGEFLDGETYGTTGGNSDSSTRFPTLGSSPAFIAFNILAH